MEEINRIKVLQTLTYRKRADVLRGPLKRVTFQSNKFCYHRASLGTFGRLPTEILCLVFDECNLNSLSTFRRVNRHLRFQVEHWLAYGLLLQWVPSALHVFARTGADMFHTAETLVQVLFTSRCGVCGKFGGYLYLPTCTRCCFKCMETKMDLSTIPYETVLTLYGNILSPHHLQRLRCLRAIPKEPRTPKRDSTGSQRCLFSFQEVYTAVLALCPDRTKIRFPFGQEKLFPYDARIFYTWGPRLGAAREVTTSFPYLTAWTTSTGDIHRQLEYARCCLACSVLPKRVNRAVGFTKQKVPADALVRFEEEFSEQEVLEHLAGCELARRMWSDRNMGLTKTVYIGPFGLGPLE